MKTLLIVYHSMTGAAEQLSAAAARGAQLEPGVLCTRRHAADTTPQHVLDAAGYLFVTPENLASMAGLMKDFFDRCYYPVFDQINGRPYATIIAAGTDGAGAARQLARIATGWRLREVAPPLLVRNGAQTPEAIVAPKTVPATDRAAARELGAVLAAGLASGIF